MLGNKKSELNDLVDREASENNVAETSHQTTVMHTKGYHESLQGIGKGIPVNSQMKENEILYGQPILTSSLFSHERKVPKSIQPTKEDTLMKMPLLQENANEDEKNRRSCYSHSCCVAGMISFISTAAGIVGGFLIGGACDTCDVLDDVAIGVGTGLGVPVVAMLGYGCYNYCVSSARTAQPSTDIGQSDFKRNKEKGVALQMSTSHDDDSKNLQFSNQPLDQNSLATDSHSTQRVPQSSHGSSYQGKWIEHHTFKTGKNSNAPKDGVTIAPPETGQNVLEEDVTTVIAAIDQKAQENDATITSETEHKVLEDGTAETDQNALEDGTTINPENDHNTQQNDEKTIIDILGGKDSDHDDEPSANHGMGI
jgi:hypothetical protein